MENKNYNERKSRSRGDNWTQHEKDLFMEVMKHSAHIVDTKETDTNSNKRKHLEWLKVQQKLQGLTGKPRDVLQLKGFWRRSKLAAKKSVSMHRKALALQATVGGQRPPSPPSDDLKMMEMCPTDFVTIEENVYDSDVDSQSSVSKTALLNGTNLEIKKQLMEEEHALKIKFQQQEIAHQQQRHKLEIDILMLEKEKKMLEIEVSRYWKLERINEKNSKNRKMHPSSSNLST